MSLIFAQTVMKAEGKASHTNSRRTASATPTATASPTVTPTPSPTPMPVSAAEKKSLQKDFDRAQIQEEKYLSRLESADERNFQNAQTSQQKNWRLNERRVRRQFFDQHMSGPARRTYVQDYLQRKEKFDEALKEEAERVKAARKSKHELLKKTQMQNKTMFQKSLDANQRPSGSLWPHN
jgi:hypothetical protein